MQYINPVGEIGLIKNKDYNGDINYKNTVLFANKTSQSNYFTTKATHLHRYQYNKDRSSFNIGLPINIVSTYSYLYFESGDNDYVFERKRYYAFITDIKYINNTTTEISFIIDIIQTFMFDIEVGRCLVEREHTVTDNLFEHITPENISIDEALCTKEIKKFSERMLCGIILNKALRAKTIEYDGKTYSRTFQVTFAPPYFQGGGVVGGVPNTLFWYTGIPINAKDVTYYRERLDPLNKTIDTQPLYYYDNDDNPLTEGQESNPQFFTASHLLYNIVNGNFSVDDGVLSEDNIVSVYIYPEEASNIHKQTEANELGYNLGVSSHDFSESSIGNFKSLYDGGSYSPKNNKLYTYPYSYLEAINNEGQKTIYKLENFDHNRIQNPYQYSFRILYSYIEPVCIALVPIDYEGDDFSYEQSLTVTGFPHPYYSGNRLNQYLQQNSAKRDSALISSALSTAVGTIASLYSGNPLPYVSSAAGFVSSYVELQSAIEDLKNTPPQSYSIFNTEYMNTVLNRCGFIIKVKNIRAELAEQIDTYFTMYGYKINYIKEPNIFRYLKDNSEPIRPSFNYLKTTNVVVKSNSLENEMLDSETRSNVAKILDNGITFWSDNDNVGNYGIDNNAPL